MQTVTQSILKISQSMILFLRPLNHYLSVSLFTPVTKIIMNNIVLKHIQWTLPTNTVI